MRHLVAVGISHLGSDKVPIRKWRDKSPNLVDGHVEVTLLQSELGSYLGKKVQLEISEILFKNNHLHLVTGKFSHFMIPGRQIVYSILFFSMCACVPPTIFFFLSP